MDKLSLFQALAQYDYRTMVHLYAEEGMDSLRSMSNWIQVQQNISCSAEEKRDESLLNYGRKNRSLRRNQSETMEPSHEIFNAIKELKLIVHQTSNVESSNSATRDQDDGTTNIVKKKASSRNNFTEYTRRGLEELPDLPLLAPPASFTSSIGNTQRKFRSCTFRCHFEGRRQKSDADKMVSLIDRNELEDIMYERAKTFTNAPPEASFSVHHRRGGDFDKDFFSDNSSCSDSKEIKDTMVTYFDGSVAIGTPVVNNEGRGLGGGSGTIQHLACAIDSPFGLALVLAMDADVSSRHTTFRRLLVHEAACYNSPYCLRLLLELGKRMNSTSCSNNDADTNNEGCMGCQTQGDDSDFIHLEKRQKSINCLSDLTKSNESKPASTGRIAFSSLLNLAMDLIGQMEENKITEIEAARTLLSKATISDVNKGLISVICRVDSQHEVKKSSSQLYPQFISFLRETTSSLSSTDGHGNTALHWAAFKNSAACIKLLFEYNADPNAVAESTGWRPLHDAAYSDSSDAISILIEAGADVNSKAHSGATPLCFAAQEDSPTATRLLLEAGADPTIRCENAPSNADENTNNNSHHSLLQQTRFSGYTPLHYCAHYNSYKAAVVLLEHGILFKGKCLFDIEDLNNKFPIHIVAERGSCDVMRELLHNGVQVDCARNKSRETQNEGIETSSITSLGNGVQSDDMEVDEAQDDEVQDDQMPDNVADSDNESSPSPIVRTQNATSNLISSPILRSLIPSEPRNSPKPWNCLTQSSIDECKLLLQEAECSWAPSRHYIFTQNDRASIFEVMKVAVRLNHIPNEIWLCVLKFCGRGWFDPPDYLMIEES